MFKNFKFNIGITLIVQSISFVILFFMLYRKKKNLANTFWLYPQSAVLPAHIWS